MNKTTLGKTGFEVSKLGFGAWPIGGLHYGEVSDKDAEATLEAYLDLGGNFIDTARGYGKSEEIIGNVLRKRGNPEKVFISSKTMRLDEKGIREDLSLTLRNLKKDYVDLYYIHKPPVSLDETYRLLDVFDKLKDEKKILSTGISVRGIGNPNVDAINLDECQAYIQSGRVDVLQLIFSIFRQRLRDIFPMAKKHGVGIVARTVLENGFLTGKYKPGHVFDENDHRRRWPASKLNTILEEVQSLNHNQQIAPFKNLAELAIAFAMNEAELDAIIVGAKSTDQVQETFSSKLEFKMSEGQYSKLVTTYSGRTDEFNI